MKKEIGEKKKNRKEYLYAVAVLGVVGLLFAMATGVPIGAQIAVPALSSVAYFFDGGHELNVPQATWYYITHGHWPRYQDWKDFLIQLGLGYFFAGVIASLLAAAGVITWSVVVAILASTGTGIAIAGSILAF